jgi:hypothetical protein
VTRSGLAEGVHDALDHLVGVDDVDEVAAQLDEDGAQGGAVAEQPAFEAALELGAQRVDEDEHGERGEQGVEQQEHGLVGEAPGDPQQEGGVDGGDGDDEERHRGDAAEDLREVEEALAHEGLRHEVQVDGGDDRADHRDAGLAERQRATRLA